MMDFSSWALNNKKLIYFFVVVMVCGGLYSFWIMPKLEDPEIKVKQAMVVTTYPGASAHEVELEVTDVLEKSIRSMNTVDEVISRSSSDVSIITVTLLPTVQNSDMEQNWDMLRRKVNDVQSQFPEGAGKSVVMDNFGDVFGLFYAVTAQGFSDQEMDDYLEMVKRSVQEIDGITAVELYGIRSECINISLMQDKMANLGVHPVEVLTTLKGQNQTVYSGYFESGDNRIRVTINDRYKTVNDIKQLLLQGHEKDQLRLSDIADVSLGYSEPVRNELFYDGEQAYGLSIAAKSGTDITKLGKIVEKKIENLRQTQIPAGIDFHKVFFQSERVNDALYTFLINLLESVIIVVVVLMFTMGIKSGMIIGINLCIIVFGSFLILNFFGGTLQRVSLAAFILAMGMLVDNAIVIIDGILVDLNLGKEKKEALTSIGKKTAMPLLAATLIAILAFFPIFLSPDTAGTYVHDLFLVLAISLLLSWVLALTLVPIHAGHSLKPLKAKNTENPYESRPYRILRSVLAWALCHKTTAIVVSLLLITSSLLCYRFLPQGFFPDMNYDQLYIEYKLPEGRTTERVKKDLYDIQAYLKTKSDITHVTMSIGGTPSRYNLVRSIAMPSMSYGELIVDFTSPKSLVSSVREIQEYLTKNYPEAFVRVKRYNLMYKNFTVEAMFSGPDPAVLKDLTRKAEDIMRKNPNTMLVTNDWEPESPILTVKYNQPVARSLGLSRSDVGISLLAATEGIPTSIFKEGSHTQTIYLKSLGSDGKPINDLINAQVFGMMPPFQNMLDKELVMGLLTGSISEEDVISEMLRTVPLSQATNGIQIDWQDPVVVRRNGQRAMKAQCEPFFGTSVEKARQSVATEIEAIPLPQGYSLMWDGEFKASAQASANLFKNFPLAIILMIALLIMLFNDYKKPIIIFCCIPLIFVGVVYGMLLSGKVFGFVAIVGVLGLIGMMIKNGIVLMDEISLQLKSGVEPMKALLDSSSSRFRPVMMASLTTILGMIPLLPDDLFGPLAVTIMGGLFVGTLITLLFIPILYAIFFHIKVKKDN